jgi:hypothetical protein
VCVCVCARARVLIPVLLLSILRSRGLVSELGTYPKFKEASRKCQLAPELASHRSTLLPGQVVIRHFR